jgi:hypothetical protein
MTASNVGFLTGISLGEHGTSLIPEWSGIAKNTSALNDSRADLMRRQYNAAVGFNEGLENQAMLMSYSALAIIAVDITVGTIFPQVAPAIKLGLGIAAAELLAPSVAIALMSGIGDLQLSHKLPVLSKHQEDWKISPNTYPKISGEPDSYTPYRMEEFLYEKPFVNLRVKSVFNSDWEDQKKDTLGLFGYDSSSGKYVSLGVAADFKEPDLLAFKSGTDWETFGAKKERWVFATGLDNEKIPIRHADRYPIPAFKVDKYIEKYEFEVDDLMPHRLRQIRINFNFNEDIG